MPISDFLTHQVAVVARLGVLDENGRPDLDEDGQPRRIEHGRMVRAAIQPKTGIRSATEALAIHQAGVELSTHTIYTVDRDIRGADVIQHDPANCQAHADLPFGRYEVTGIRDAAGVGHHLEIDARLIGRPVVGQGSGSGSGS